MSGAKLISEWLSRHLCWSKEYSILSAEQDEQNIKNTQNCGSGNVHSCCRLVGILKIFESKLKIRFCSMLTSWYLWYYFSACWCSEQPVAPCHCCAGLCGPLSATTWQLTPCELSLGSLLWSMAELGHKFDARLKIKLPVAGYVATNKTPQHGMC